MAAVVALRDDAYYTARYQQTAELRLALVAQLAQIPGLQVVASVANFASCLLARNGPDAPTVVDRARRMGVFLRYFPSDPALRWRTLRIAVGDKRANDKVVDTLRAILGRPAQSSVSPP